MHLHQEERLCFYTIFYTCAPIQGGERVTARSAPALLLLLVLPSAIRVLSQTAHCRSSQKRPDQTGPTWNLLVCVTHRKTLLWGEVTNGFKWSLPSVLRSRPADPEKVRTGRQGCSQRAGEQLGLRAVLELLLCLLPHLISHPKVFTDQNRPLLHLPVEGRRVVALCSPFSGHCSVPPTGRCWWLRL